MKAGKVDVRIKRLSEDTAEFDFRKNGKSFFCMAEAVFTEEVARRIIHQLEDNLSSKGTFSEIKLFNKTGDYIKLELESRRNRYTEYLNTLKHSVPYDGYYVLFTIDYPHIFNHFRYIKNRFDEKLRFISAFYQAVIQAEPRVKSELIESIIENGDLESIYERM